jgi:glycosyltransferase involved in cell wall biosynthesis
MKIIITSQYGKVAGSSYSILWLADGLNRLGHSVSICTPKNSHLAKLSIEKGIDLLPVNFNNKIDISSAFKLARFAKKNKIDIIYAQESKDRYISILAKIIFRLDTIILLARRQRVADNNPLKRWVHQKFSTKIIVISNGLKAKMIQKGFNVNHLHMIHNGIPLSEFILEKNEIVELNNKYSITPEQFIIGCVARLKRQDLLIKALELLPQNCRLLLVGINKFDIEKVIQFKKFASLKDRIIFTGEISSRKEVLTHYALMNVHILPSQMDGFGLVSAEAMAMGIPALGSNYGGIPDVIQHGITGFIFQNNDVIDLVQKIELLIKNNPLKEQIVKNASKCVMDQFDISVTIKNYETFFLGLLKQKDRS